MKYYLTEGKKQLGEVEIEYLDTINYAFVLNNGESLSKFVIRNKLANASMRDVHIAIKGDMLVTAEADITSIEPGKCVEIEGVALVPNISRLMQLTEAVGSQFEVVITVNNRNFSRTFPLTIMAFDQWMGAAKRPELLAAFVTPNNPALLPVMQRAAEIMRMKTGHASFDGYLSGDTDHYVTQIESVWTALQEQGIAYSLCKSGFIDEGQRIRMADAVLREKFGTCLDLSILLCSICEQFGFKTSILLFNAHAYACVWLNYTYELPMVDTDYDFLLRESQNTLQPSVLLLEATGITHPQESMANAEAFANDFLASHKNDFQCSINIFSCRKNRVRPLPISSFSNHGWETTDNTDYNQLLDEIVSRHNEEIIGSPVQKVIGKQQLWERKLLDLTLRNSLLNMKQGKQIVMLNPASCAEVLSLTRQKKLDTLFDKKKAFEQTKELYRAARLAMEENGANCLFLSLGTLRWCEDGCKEPHYAPVILIPMEIVRHTPKQYVIRQRDDETIINITLMECLKQVFELSLPDFTELPETPDGLVDYQFVFSQIEAVIKNKDNWQLVADESVIGIFSFKKFVMWNDIHTCQHVVQRHPLLQSLMQGAVSWDCSPTVADLAKDTEHEVMPKDLALPIDVDSSQLRAVYASSGDNTFLLYGPPGTGKSQTITNMIANALYQGKRVLFVSEKKAALEVVQDRLAKIGLDDFCMELHSNKAEKKHFLSQLERTLQLTASEHNADWEKTAAEKLRLRKELGSFVDALHSERKGHHSLFDYINRYISIGGEHLAMSYEEASRYSDADLDAIESHLVQLDTVQQIIGVHPSRHPLLELLPLENSTRNQENIVSLLSAMPDAISKAEKKERGILNRWFFRRTAMQILQRSEEWKQFVENALIPDYPLSDVEPFRQQTNIWRSNIDKLRTWYHYSERALALSSLHADIALQHYLSGASGKATADAFRKGVYHARAMHIIDHDDRLRSFSGMLFEKIVEQYRDIIRRYQLLTIEELRCRLTSNIPTVGLDAAVNKELTKVNKSISSHGRGVTIRHIINSIPHILPRLAPCMLMSPLSVSQYLSMESNLFDLLIFDEASQIPTSEAVGAIARSKSVIVVGDPKQMPPTTFFNTNATTDEEAEFDDMESILDDCISLSMPSHYLDWHYRSQHESLIAFSNTHFYDGRLVTFPSVDDQKQRVSFVKVEGYYDFGKSRSNKSEAKSIVGETLKHLEKQWETGERYSIGIVAFSKVQSSLIEDLLMDELAKRPELYELATQEKEPIFVKNLENVQGDERDIILFSVGYGPDKSGKVSMNFGPLNQSGGERRLNVAVTRARQEMKVFSTLMPEQIDMSRTSAKGVLALKRFLEYARDGFLATPSGQVSGENTDAVASDIADYIESLGYHCTLNVGRSRCKIDIAVSSDQQTDGYLCGIILDGTNYHQKTTALDREVVMPEVFRRLGWRIIRVWTIDWLCNAELAKITLKEALSE